MQNGLYMVLFGLEDDATSLLLGDQSQRFKNLCMSGLHKKLSKVMHDKLRPFLCRSYKVVKLNLSQCMCALW